MAEQPFSGISFRLAKVGVVLAFMLGLFMSTVQLYLDLKGNEAELENLVNRVIEVTTPPAARAVHTLDDDLSLEVVNGLLAYDFIYEVTISDELGSVLASGTEPRPASSTRWLTKFIAEDSKTYVARLTIPGYGESVAGSIQFTVDVDSALAPFFERSGLILGAGMLRNTLLVLLLFVAFHLMLTRPLIQIAREMADIDLDKPGSSRLSELPNHKHDEVGQLVGTTNKMLDLMELSLAKRRAVELALRRSEEHIRQIIDSLPVMVGARNREGQYIFANKALAKFVGRKTDEMQTCHVSELLPFYLNDVSRLLELDRRIIEGEVAGEMLEESFRGNDGKPVYLQTHIMPMEFYDERVALIVSTDITERKQAQFKMEHMAYHDSLTNLPNRVHLVERLEHEIRRAKRHGYHGALLFIDLDHFKTINDSLGHPVGDEVLIQVAARLQNAVREEDLVARLSGDEFVVVLTVLDADISAAALRAAEVADKIRQKISEPYLYDEMELRVSGSVGVVVYPDDNSSVHELIRFADTAMYQVKERGRDAIEFFNTDMADKVSQQLLMEGDLRRALQEDQFELYYQPKIDCKTGAVVGAEALLRWLHPEKGRISPADFIPVLESSGLIVEVGEWLLKEACKALGRWYKKGLWPANMKLSVNISPRQFRRKTFVEDVSRILHEHPIPDASLDMEITEGVVIQNMEETINTMVRLESLGVSFSLDDFGTGYSSISYLKSLPVSTLKIDRSFVRDIVEDQNDRVLVETIVTMGCLLGMDVVAEGVEEEAQLRLLVQYGCHSYQGFLTSPAVPIEEFEAFLIK
ncbi:putative bifunctional diguanylate cyclase/phosphodiesterase [Simiduia agarivorans]|uniref:cyclic-guanylate-specific phosphodiesterase n=1 Tax=Simiduia agarivorans (strain DSM 21679 / JCM 13881 / BCRC 17597 / SA1) TaxID=1117647 RepID=K4KU55_SIMAS|nr:bifunctional diguanylate cyclase/phosphodiesterase [Simiduia agarivorans]AFU97507.1 sensory box protein [Simiduia agarivorans SA1 = DSM 21679]